MDAGELIRARRENKGLSLFALSTMMSGSPTATFIAKIERGEVTPTAATAAKLAESLDVPRDILLNATGHATPQQTATALTALASAVGEPTPIAKQIPVLDANVPSAEPERLATRLRVLRQPEDVFLIDLTGRGNEPYTGEVLASRDRKPKEGQGVIAEVGGVLSAWTWHSIPRTGDFIENGAGDKRTKGFSLFGVIIGRTVHEDFE